MPNPTIKSMADLFSEEEDRLMAEANTPERVAADEAALARAHAKALAEDIAAGRRDAAGNWIETDEPDADPEDEEGDDESEDDNTEEGEDL